MNINVFPLGFEKHLIFCIIAVIFFILQFVRTKRVYQLIMAAAIASSLLIYLSEDSSALFYGVGIAEGIMLLAALIASIVQAQIIKKKNPPKKAEQPAEG